MKDQIQGKDELIKKLKAQIGNMKEVNTDSNLSTLEFQALKTKNTQLKEELTAVRIKNDSLRDENVSIKKRYQDLYQSKAESNSNVSSRAAVPEKPKVLALGLYAMTPKYIPPQKRNNREANTPLPRKETVSLVKKTNVCVNLSTGIKYITEVSKSKSKCETKTHRNLPAKSENVKRVDNPLRNLNKRNHVDSSLSVKRRKFTLGDTCPLTRITKPEVVPLENSGSVSTSEPANNVIVAKVPSNKTTNRNKLVEQISVAKKPERHVSKGHRFSIKKTSVVHEKTNTPRSCLRWKPIGKIFKTVGLRWVPTGNILTSSTTKVDSESINGSDEDITNQYEYKQTLDVSAGTPNLSTGLRPNSMAHGHNGAGPEINNLQSGRIGSGLVTTPTTPSVPPIEKKCYYSSNNDYSSLNRKWVNV
ncbi:hypothetical protein Tco_1035564 [Tanacetum coccineum]